jgi:hypothetical protein
MVHVVGTWYMPLGSKNSITTLSTMRENLYKQQRTSVAQLQRGHTQEREALQKSRKRLTYHMNIVG